MAILRSVDGRFYDVPDEMLSRFEVSAELVRQVMAEMGGADDPGEPGPEPGGPEGPGEVEPYGRHWYRWRNCWRNHWRNCY